MRSEILKVRVTPEEKVALYAAAHRENRHFSDWARLTLLGDRDPAEASPAQDRLTNGGHAEAQAAVPGTGGGA